MPTSTSLFAAYDSSQLPEIFSSMGQVLSDYVEECQQGQGTLRSQLSLEQLRDLADRALTPTNVGTSLSTRVRELTQLYLDHSYRIQDPRCMGHQVCPPMLSSAAFQAVVGILNQGMAVAELSPFATAIEQAVVGRLCEAIGWSPTVAGGVATNGGTLANLTGVLAACHARYGDVWAEGWGQRRPAIIASSESHYSVKRAAGIMGMGSDHVIGAELDPLRRMTGKTLQLALNRADSEGRDVFCVVASAPSTPIGAIDCLTEIAEICTARSIWLHVDAVHGASMLFSPQLRSKLNGIEHASSVAWDAHKMLHVPSLATFVLYQRREHSYLPFQQSAPYLFDLDTDERLRWDGGLRTFECTKPALSAPLWLAWSLLGMEVFAAAAERCLSVTQEFHATLADDEDFEVAHRPEVNILCFRYSPSDWRSKPRDERNSLQRKLRRAIVDDAKFYVTTALLDGDDYLRVTIMHPLTSANHFRDLIMQIRSLAHRLQ